jgi:hypothetical protein
MKALHPDRARAFGTEGFEVANAVRRAAEH